jgi:hypothetical protein
LRGSGTVRLWRRMLFHGRQATLHYWGQEEKLCKWLEGSARDLTQPAYCCTLLQPMSTSPKRLSLAKIVSCGFRFLLPCKWDLRTSGILRSIDGYLLLPPLPPFRFYFHIFISSSRHPAASIPPFDETAHFPSVLVPSSPIKLVCLLCLSLHFLLFFFTLFLSFTLFSFPFFTVCLLPLRSPPCTFSEPITVPTIPYINMYLSVPGFLLGLPGPCKWDR